MILNRFLFKAMIQYDQIANQHIKNQTDSHQKMFSNSRMSAQHVNLETSDLSFLVCEASRHPISVLPAPSNQFAP